MQFIVIICSILALLTGCSSNHNYQEFYSSKDYHSGYVKVDQGKLFYESFGKGAPIIVLHGGPGGTHDILLPQMLELAKDNRVIFYDQRGSGKSLEAKVTPDYVNTARFVEDLEEFRLSQGIDKFILLGHSWGGLLAMNYALKYSDHLNGLVLLGSCPANYEGQMAFMKEWGFRTRNITKDLAPLFSPEGFDQMNKEEMYQLNKKLFSVYFYNPKNIEKLTIHIDEKAVRSGSRVMADMIKSSMFQKNIDLLPSLKILKVSTLIVHGQQDIIPAWTAREIELAIPNSKSCYINKSDHFPYIEAPEEMFGCIRGFMSEIIKNDKKNISQSQ